jgi:hypothetical protein
LIPLYFRIRFQYLDEGRQGILTILVQSLLPTTFPWLHYATQYASPRK